VTPESLVGLAAVYHLDMGRRTVDLDLWASLLSDEAERYGGSVSVIEVGCGTGRVPRGVALRHPRLPIESWVGIDVDPAMVRAFQRRAPAWATPVEGDAVTVEAWDEARGILGGAADVVLVPYATLFLVPHERQAHLLRLAVGSSKPGALIAAEVFVPQWTDSGTYENTVWCEPEEPDALGRKLVRRTVYQVDGSRRVTRATRQYGPATPGLGSPRLDRWRSSCRVEETIHWRLPAELPRLAEEAGMGVSRVLRNEHDRRVPEGYVLLVGRS